MSFDSRRKSFSVIERTLSKLKRECLVLVSLEIILLSKAFNSQIKVRMLSFTVIRNITL